MKDLPIELVGAVVDNVSSTPDLLSLRSVNATCNRLVTPHVFSRIHVRNSVQSAQNCQNIIASPPLATHVREIVYDSRDHARFCLLPPGTQGTCDELEIEELEGVLTETFCSLANLENLESVVLNFWPSFCSQYGTEIQEHPFWFTNRQITVLHAVYYAIKSSCVRSLVLNNVVLMTPSCYDFARSMTNSSLHHFSMTVVANCEVGTWSGSKVDNGSLSSLLPPSNTHLKSLVLRSPQGLYHSRDTRLQSFNYPALETLVLENVVFEHAPSVDGVEEFIVRHKASLRRLELHSCTSYVPSLSTPVRRWSTIWKRLEEELVSLREVVVGDVHQGYALLDGASGYVPHPSLPMAPSELAKDDEKLYHQFSDHVNLRSSVLAKLVF